VHITEVSLGYHSLTARYDCFLLVPRLAKCIWRDSELPSFFQILRLPFIYSTVLSWDVRGSSFYAFLSFTQTVFNEHADDYICYLQVFGPSTLETEETMFHGQRALRLWLELIALSELLFVTIVRRV
jgi:hypothetical protein